MLNNLSNLADKAISDEELENVSGGANTMPKKCPSCKQIFQWDTTTACVCPYCGAPC